MSAMNIPAILDPVNAAGHAPNPNHVRRFPSASDLRLAPIKAPPVAIIRAWTFGIGSSDYARARSAMVLEVEAAQL